MATLQEAPYKPEGCTCPEGANYSNDLLCPICMEEYEAWAESEAGITYCAVCDGAGHSAGEFGELCLANGRSWFEPSDPRDLYDAEDRF
jgi:Zn-finger nucleic acid-binding protein